MKTAWRPRGRLLILGVRRQDMVQDFLDRCLHELAWQSGADDLRGNHTSSHGPEKAIQEDGEVLEVSLVVQVLDELQRQGVKPDGFVLLIRTLAPVVFCIDLNVLAPLPGKPRNIQEDEVIKTGQAEQVEEPFCSIPLALVKGQDNAVSAETDSGGAPKLVAKLRELGLVENVEVSDEEVCRRPLTLRVIEVSLTLPKQIDGRCSTLAVEHAVLVPGSLLWSSAVPRDLPEEQPSQLLEFDTGLTEEQDRGRLASHPAKDAVAQTSHRRRPEGQGKAPHLPPFFDRRSDDVAVIQADDRCLVFGAKDPSRQSP